MTRVKHSESAGGVVMNGERVVLVEQRGHVWSLPKGHLESGETPLAAATREIREECGIRRLNLVRELGVYERHRIGREPGAEDRSELKRIRIFLFTTEEEELAPEDRKILGARWFPKSEVAAALTHPRDREFIEGLRL